jgi:hypothetical protein
MTYSYTNFGISTPLVGKKSFEAKKMDAVMESLEYFKTLKAKKRQYKITFQRVNENGDLDSFENGIHIILPNEEVKSDLAEVAMRNNKKYDASKRSTYLLYQYNVDIVEVDEKKKEVIVSWRTVKMKERDKVARMLQFMVNEKQADRKEIENVVREEVKELIAGELKEQVEKMSPRTRNSFEKKLIHEGMTKEAEERGMDKIIVPAQIVSADDRGCVINLLGYDIPGYVPSNYWTYGRMDDLSAVVNVNEIVDVEVFAYRKYKEGTSLPVYTKNGKAQKVRGMYLCARTPLIPNPWDTLPFKEGDYVRVKCVDVKDHNWFGFIDGIDLEIYCEYPKAEKDFKVIEGKEYECYLYRVNAQTKLLKAKTMKEVLPRLSKT